MILIVGGGPVNCHPLFASLAKRCDSAANRRCPFASGRGSAYNGRLEESFDQDR